MNKIYDTLKKEAKSLECSINEFKCYRCYDIVRLYRVNRILDRFEGRLYE